MTMAMKPGAPRPAAGRQNRRKDRQAPGFPCLAFASGLLRGGHLLRCALHILIAAAPAHASDNNAADIPLRIVRERPAVPPLLAQAHALLRAGKVEAAADAYARASQDDPASADALLGLAVIAERSGDFALAEQRYRQALAADPRKVDAEAGLLNLVGGSDPGGSESRLKELLAAHPGGAVAHFALGNLHAASARWAEARLSYRRALAADRGNPDYLFNLAVSLDRLHRPTEAGAAYRAALAALARRGGGFARETAEARIAALTPALPVPAR